MSRGYYSLNKTEKLEVLVDGKLEKFSRYGYLYRENRPHSLSPVAFHRTVQEWSGEKKENFWILTCGHVYVFNYNADTIKPDLPLTIEAYQEREKQKQLADEQ